MNKKINELSDSALVAGFKDLVVGEQEGLASQLEHLAELDRRKLFFQYDSLRAYVVGEHGMEDYTAERRIRAARLIVRLPHLLRLIESGRLNLTHLEIAMGCAHREKLCDSELSALLESLVGKSTRAAQREVARLYPRSCEEIPYDRIRPLNEELSEVRLVATQECLDTLEEIRGLIAHSHPGCTLGQLIEHIAADYRKRHHPEEKAKRALERKERAEKASEEVEEPTAPLLDSNAREPRCFSKKQETELTLRDGYRCAYVDKVTGKRCTSTYALQKDHVDDWASGGKTVIENGRLLCAGHHKRVSFLKFGDWTKYMKPPLRP